MSFEAPSFTEALRNCVHGYSGAHAAAIERAPDVFEFFARLFAERDLPDSARPLVNAVLAYFVAPFDVMSEQELGPFGLLDDLYVASHAFNLLRREVPNELLHAAWRKRSRPAPLSIPGRPATDLDPDDLDAVMALVRSESRSALGKQGRAALRMAGLS